MKVSKNRKDLMNSKIKWFPDYIETDCICNKPIKITLDRLKYSNGRWCDISIIYTHCYECKKDVVLYLVRQDKKTNSVRSKRGKK